jgi:GMP synthase (glutamine-hydrolysing)
VTLSQTEEVKNWADMVRLAKLIPKICHNINRVCYAFGDQIKYQVLDITTTHLTPNVLSTLQEADHLAQNILHQNGYGKVIAQMPVICIPVHFDRDVAAKQCSCQRSIVIRTFITEDFMTGIPAVPNKHIPLDVSRLCDHNSFFGH